MLKFLMSLNVYIQAETVLRQVIIDRIKLISFLSKMNHAILELQLQHKVIFNYLNVLLQISISIIVTYNDKSNETYDL